MQIFEVIQPGVILKDRLTTDQDAEMLLFLLESSFYDANLALHLYREARMVLAIHMRTENWRDDFQGMPQILLMKVPLMHARSFIYALDSFQKALKLLTERPTASKEQLDCLSDFNALLPTLNDVRDSAHHVEDRIRRKRRNKDIVTPDGLYIDTMQDDYYTTTLGDGQLGRLEISDANMQGVRMIYQRILNSFTWLNSMPLVLPRRNSVQ